MNPQFSPSSFVIFLKLFSSERRLYGLFIFRLRPISSSTCREAIREYCSTAIKEKSEKRNWARLLALQSCGEREREPELKRSKCVGNAWFIQTWIHFSHNFSNDASFTHYNDKFVDCIFTKKRVFWRKIDKEGRNSNLEFIKLDLFTVVTSVSNFY